jgi:ATP-binding cassette subfamily B protein
MTRYASFLRDIKLIEFPEYRQPDADSCGATTIHMILTYYGIDENLEDIERLAGTNHEFGTSIAGMKRVADEYNLKYEERTLTIDDLKHNIDKGRPIIIMIQAWSVKDNVDWKNEWNQGHYVCVRGYDSRRIYFADPVNVKITFLSYVELEDRWHGYNDNDDEIYNWGMIFLNESDYRTMDMEPMG